MSKNTKKAITKAAKAIVQCYEDNLPIELSVYYNGTEDCSSYHISNITLEEMSEKIDAAAESGWLVFEDDETGEVRINMANVDCIKL